GELHGVEINVSASRPQVRQLRGQRSAVAFRRVPLAGERAANSACGRRGGRIVRIVVIEWSSKEAPDDWAINAGRYGWSSVNVRIQKIIVGVGRLCIADVDVVDGR